MAIAGESTVFRMQRTKRVDPAILDHFGRELEKWVRDTFDDNKTRAGQALGISQGHVSAMIRGLRGPGLPTIILLAQKTGRTVDSWLFPEREMTREDRIMAEFAELKADVRALRAEPSTEKPHHAPRPRRR